MSIPDHLKPGAVLPKAHAWIGVDLDGTLAHYDRWVGMGHIGNPIKPMVERVQRWLDRGVKVKIFTARMTEPNVAQRQEFERALAKWTFTHIGEPLEATCIKDFHMVQLWDDRAVMVEMNTGRVPEGWVTNA